MVAVYEYVSDAGYYFDQSGKIFRLSDLILKSPYSMKYVKIFYNHVTAFKIKEITFVQCLAVSIF